MKQNQAFLSKLGLENLVETKEKKKTKKRRKKRKSWSEECAPLPLRASKRGKGPWQLKAGTRCRFKRPDGDFVEGVIGARGKAWYVCGAESE